LSIPDVQHEIEIEVSKEVAMSTDTTVAQLFADRNYGGASLRLSVGNYDVETLKTTLGNDTLSSLKVTDGYAVELYPDPGFAGMCFKFSSDTPYIGDDINDKTSSVRVVTNPQPRVGPDAGQQIVFVQPPSYH
jgi:hypothetical protein